MACHPEPPFTPEQVAWLDQRFGAVLARTPLRFASYTGPLSDADRAGLLVVLEAGQTADHVLENAR